MRIAMGQIAPTLGDFQGNSQLILDCAQQAQSQSCDLLVLPELSLLGYHPFDLLERPELYLAQKFYLDKLVQDLPSELPVLLGALEKAEGAGKPFYDSALLIHQNKIIRTFQKELLPAYDVFDDSRFFRSGEIKNNQFEFLGKKIQILLCEDMWGWSENYTTNPLLALADQGIDLIINLSASPFEKNKMTKRIDFAARTARHLNAPLLYVNQTGGQDELIFDGRSFALDQQGELLDQAAAFASDFIVIDLQQSQLQPTTKTSSVHDHESDLIRQALVIGIRDFFKKCGVSKAHVGLSGGVDSAVVLALCAEALGSANVVAIALPSDFNAPESLEYARQMAGLVGCEFYSLPISQLYQQSLESYSQAFGEKKFSLMHENLQARLRGVLLMAFANDRNSLLVSTSNKSEMTMGYSTLYGDMCGALAPLGDLLKEEVYQVARHYQRKGWLPLAIIEREPSAELRPNQKDSDSLPAYSILDKAVDDVIRDKASAQTDIEKRVLTQSLRSEFKRWQAPPILRISSHAFGRGRRIPIASASRFCPLEEQN